MKSSTQNCRGFSFCAVAFAVVLVAGVPAPPHPSAKPVDDNTHPCAIEVYHTTSGCAAFRVTPIRILTAIPSWHFPHDQQPEEAAALGDGSVMVSTDRQGLYRIVNGRVEAIWPAGEPCKRPKHAWWFRLVGSFDKEVVLKHGDSAADARPDVNDSVAGVRLDGSLSFDQNYLSNIKSVVQADGLIWFFRRSDEGDYSLDAYDPRTRRTTEVDVPGLESLFGAPNGHAYAGTGNGLYQLEARPSPHSRFVRGTYDGALPQGLGRDGSFWASTITDVIHIHPDGSVHVMRLVSPRIGAQGSSVRLEPIALTMAPDGAMWTQWTGLVRITNDDRIQRLELPPQGDWEGAISFAPDSTVWLVVGGPSSYQSEGVVQFAPAPEGSSVPTLPFGTPHPSPAPTIFTPCPLPKPRSLR